MRTRRSRLADWPHARMLTPSTAPQRSRLLRLLTASLIKLTNKFKFNLNQVSLKPTDTGNHYGACAEKFKREKWHWLGGPWPRVGPGVN
jgi:hypothetical protein